MGEGSLFAAPSTPQVNANSSMRTERQVAAGGETSLTLSSFTYTVGTDSLIVFKNGDILAPGVDYFESTTSEITLATAALTADVFIIIGFVGISGTVTVNTVDIFIASVAAMRAYAGSNTMLYLQNTAAPPDGTEGMFQRFSGAAPGTYSDDGVNVIVPTGGDGSSAWLRATETVRRTALQLETVSQAEAEAGVATTTRVWTAQRVAQAIAAAITSTVTGSFIATLYEALSNTNKYTDAEKTKVAGLLTPLAAPTDHIRLGNQYRWNGLSAAFVAINNAVTLASTWRSIGPTGSGANYEWSILDQVPSEAQAVIIGVVGNIVADGLGVPGLTLFARQTGSGRGVGSTAVAQFNAENSATGVGSGDVELTLLVDTSRRFDLQYTQQNVSQRNFALYYRGFVIDNA